MPFVEVFVPKGTLPETQRKVITEELVAEVMQAEGAPDTPSARSISWLVFHEADGWSVGGAPVAPGDPARFVMRASPSFTSLSTVAAWRARRGSRCRSSALRELSIIPIQTSPRAKLGSMPV